MTPRSVSSFFLCTFLLGARLIFSTSTQHVDGNDNLNHPHYHHSVAFGLKDVVLIKVGGSSITHKATKESINTDALEWFASTMANHVAPAFRIPDRICINNININNNNNNNDDDQKSSSCRSPANENATSAATAYVVIHGAGSFGHHFAKEFGLEGKSEPPPPAYSSSSSSSSLDVSSEQRRRFTMQGLAQTRLSVQTLNRNVVSALIDHGVNAVGISPCFGIPSLQAHGGDKDTVAHLQDLVWTTLRAGLVPVLHGDACLYGHRNDKDKDEYPHYDSGAGILSGDIVMEMLGHANWVSRAIFLTDVDGVYTRDPKTDAKNAEHLPEIAVHIEASTSEILLSVHLEASGSTHQHDVTGGLKTKLQSAASIASTGKNVTIVKCGSESAEKVIRGGEQSVDLATVLFRRLE